MGVEVDRVYVDHALREALAACRAGDYEPTDAVGSGAAVAAAHQHQEERGSMAAVMTGHSDRAGYEATVQAACDA
jgi:hypothetical protein